MRLRIEYLDHNESFAAQLPREGVVVAQPMSSDSELSWYLLRLDVPVTYEHAVYKHFLLASRWEGHSVSGPESTSVFILLVPQSEASVADGFCRNRYLHVAWGMSRVVGA